MYLIDSHAHIFTEQFQVDIATVIDNAASSNVARICMPNIDKSTLESMMALHEKYPETCFPMMGLHPCSVKENYEEQLEGIKSYLDASDDFVAIGEMGIDLYWDTSLKEQQIEAFKIQVGWALEKNMPIVIHCRNSMDLVIEILEEMDEKDLTGVFHCFTGDESQAARIKNLGFYIGLGGIITFKNSNMDDVVRSIDLSQIILETDSPYLAPTPKRGKRNEPAYVRYVAEKIASLKNISLEEVADTTSRNVLKLYKWQ